MNKYQFFSIIFIGLALSGCATLHKTTSKPVSGWNAQTDIPVIPITSNIIAQNNSYYQQTKAVTNKIAHKLNK